MSICTETSLVKRMELRFGYSDSAASDLVPGHGFMQLSTQNMSRRMSEELKP